MKIPDALKKKWQDLWSHGDGKKIAERSGCTQNDISRALNSDDCSDEVFEAIASFYKEKEEKLKEYLDVETIKEG